MIFFTTKKKENIYSRHLSCIYEYHKCQTWNLNSNSSSNSSSDYDLGW